MLHLALEPSGTIKSDEVVCKAMEARSDLTKQHGKEKWTLKEKQF
jgi:hypothetical protein